MKRHSKWHAINGVGACILLVCGLTACGSPNSSDQGNIKATVGYYPGALLSLPALIASDKGFYAESGLDVELVSVPNGASMTAAVASGSVMFGNNSYDNLSTAVSKGLPLKAVTGGTVKTPLSLLVREGIDLPHGSEGYPAVIQDLRDSKWGVIGLGISMHFIAQEFIDESGGDASKTTFLAVGLPDTAQPALQRGTVDTYLSLEPLATIAEVKGFAKNVSDLAQDEGPEQLKNLNYNGWWASNRTIEQDKETVDRFVKANEKAFCWYSDSNNFDEVVTILQKRVPVPDLTDAQYREMIKGTLPSYGVDITAKSIATWQDIMVKNGVIKEPLNYDDLVAPTAKENFTCPS